MWKLGMASPFPNMGPDWECHICPHVAPKGRCGSGSDGGWLWQVGSQNPLSAVCHKGMPGMQTVLRHQGKSLRLQLHQEIFRNCSSSLVHVQAFYAVRCLKDSCQLTKTRRHAERDSIWHIVFTHTLPITATQECCHMT